MKQNGRAITADGHMRYSTYRRDPSCSGESLLSWRHWSLVLSSLCLTVASRHSALAVGSRPEFHAAPTVCLHNTIDTLFLQAMCDAKGNSLNQGSEAFLNAKRVFQSSMAHRLVCRSCQDSFLVCVSHRQETGMGSHFSINHCALTFPFLPCPNTQLHSFLAPSLFRWLLGS